MGYWMRPGIWASGWCYFWLRRFLRHRRGWHCKGMEDYLKSRCLLGRWNSDQCRQLHLFLSAAVRPNHVKQTCWFSVRWWFPDLWCKELRLPGQNLFQRIRRDRWGLSGKRRRWVSAVRWCNFLLERNSRGWFSVRIHHWWDSNSWWGCWGWERRRGLCIR